MFAQTNGGWIIIFIIFISFSADLHFFQATELQILFSSAFCHIPMFLLFSTAEVCRQCQPHFSFSILDYVAAHVTGIQPAGWSLFVTFFRFGEWYCAVLTGKWRSDIYYRMCPDTDRRPIIIVLVVFLAHDAICVAVSASDHLPFMLGEKRDTGSEGMRHYQLSLRK